jgi:predicted nucleic acid-binding protein
VTVVVDASVVVAGLASGGAAGRWAESVLAGEPLAAPHVLPLEAASILHRAESAGEISADAVSLAYVDLGRLRVEYFPYAPFAERIWELFAALPDPRLEQEALVRRLRVGIADAQTSRKRIELQIRALLESSGDQAELSELHTQDQSLQEHQDKLIDASQRLQAQVDAARLAKTEAGSLQPGAAPQPGPANLSCYDAWYVALAEFLGVKLATLNAGLARAPGPRCGFWLPPAE